MIGERFGRLIVLHHVKNGENGCKKLLCKCDCGNEKIVPLKYLIYGDTKSCGCLHLDRSYHIAKTYLITHGLTHSKVYRAWGAMKSRCKNKKYPSYKRYGGRGISFHKHWIKFENFLEDMGLPPTSKHTLDRIDSHGNYEPGNCRWATMKEQQNNRLNNIVLKHNGEYKTLKQWSELTGLNYRALIRRINYLYWPTQKALTTPIRRKKPNAISSAKT